MADSKVTALSAESGISSDDVLYVVSAGTTSKKVTNITIADGASVSGSNTGDQSLPTRDSLGVDTDDSPQFAGINLGHASDTTFARVSAGVVSIEGNNIITANNNVGDLADSTSAAIGIGTIELGHASDTTISRTGAGDIAVEGNAVYRAGGTDVPLTDGGTGCSTAATAFAALYPVVETTGTSASLTVNTINVANNAALVTLTLPASAVLGSVIEVIGKGAGLWKVAQNANQLIHFGSLVTTTGTGGDITATQQYDAIKMVCTVADTTWTVVSSQGTPSVT